MNVAVFHPGTQHSWQTATALQQLGQLEWYATSIFYDPDRWPYRIEKFLPPPLSGLIRREFERFRYDALDPSLVRTAGGFEWAERVAARLGAARLARRLDRIGNRRFAGLLAGQIASDRPFALWGYDASSLESFILGREHGRHCILDRTTGDLRALNDTLASLKASHAKWFHADTGLLDQAVIDRADAEYEAADTILVGSEFAARTIREHARGGQAVASKLRVISYGYDEQLFGSLPPPAPMRGEEPVRFLFAGHMSPLKGVHHVLEAFSRIPPSAASLTLVGPMAIPRAVFAPYADRVSYIPTVPRSAVPGIMAAHHVLLFPSHFEGAGIVLFEALAAGMGLIQSPSASIAVDGNTGILLDEVSTEALYIAMAVAIEDPRRVEAWRHAAQSRARQFSFARYKENIATLLKDLDISH